jgi:hypothetical protein
LTDSPLRFMIPSPLNFEIHMPNITLEAIAELLKTELKPVNETLAQHTELLNRHTTMLDGLVTDVKTLLDEKMITVHRFDRLEHWAQ